MKEKLLILCMDFGDDDGPETLMYYVPENVFDVAVKLSSEAREYWNDSKSAMGKTYDECFEFFLKQNNITFSIFDTEYETVYMNWREFNSF